MVSLNHLPVIVASERQTMNHIVDTCPSTKSEGGLNLLHEADDDAEIRLESAATAALAKKKRIGVVAASRPVNFKQQLYAGIFGGRILRKSTTFSNGNVR